ncbi:P-loop containing nucleoside triphosphate hydrolase protein [Xylariaceae sp. FL0016]|nr:P-loop containing nucleoside triphosphate hydrolase protein [Xylariaceae sp. FL0016]
MSISLDSAALGQLHGEQKALLDTIDDLRQHGVDRFVDLPQIIVVGDQSSGKSSVLEAISRVRFPVKSGLCTRFATELVLRTGRQTRVDVRIQYAHPSKDQDQPFDETRFDKDELPKVIEEAQSAMLLGSATFSEDVLRVEITGPDVPHLTLVDLPGFYHSEDDTQSAAGREIVDRLVERYMARKNSIILAIVSARNQLILQKVLSRVRHHDRDRSRTLGIITKPDLLSPESKDEEDFIRLAKNQDKSHHLLLGWHVLRNRGEAQGSLSHEQRDKEEREFFESGAWATVPSKNRGVDTLRKRLSTILLDHIKNNLQGLIESIEEQINDRQQRLTRLGEPRTTPKELRSYMNRIASEFHILSLHAIEGNYLSDDFFGGLYPGQGQSAMSEDEIKKLRALVRNLNRVFVDALNTKGKRRVILHRRDEDIGEEGEEQEGVWEEESADGSEDTSPPGSPLRFWESLSLTYTTFRDPEKVPFEVIAKELESLSSVNQGVEYPDTPNDRIAHKLFQDQSAPWKSIAQHHLRLVLQVARSFVEMLITHITLSDHTTRAAILSDVVVPFFDKKGRVLEEKLEELLRFYRNGHPEPLHTEFKSLFALRRKKTQAAGFLRQLLKDNPALFTKEALEDLLSEKVDQPTSGFDAELLIDKATTYYEMSIRTFTDNVMILAIENCLISELPTILTTNQVNCMDDEELKNLASESTDTQTERAELQLEYDAMQKGLRICNKFRAHGSVPSVLVNLDGDATISKRQGNSDHGAHSSARKSHLSAENATANSGTSSATPSRRVNTDKSNTPQNMQAEPTRGLGSFQLPTFSDSSSSAPENLDNPFTSSSNISSNSHSIPTSGSAFGGGASGGLFGSPSSWKTSESGSKPGGLFGNSTNWRPTQGASTSGVAFDSPFNPKPSQGNSTSGNLFGNLSSSGSPAPSRIFGDSNTNTTSAPDGPTVFATSKPTTQKSCK